MDKYRTGEEIVAKSCILQQTLTLLHRRIMPVCDNMPIDTVSILIGRGGKVKAREKIPGTTLFSNG